MIVIYFKSNLNIWFLSNALEETWCEIVHSAKWQCLLFQWRLLCIFCNIHYLYIIYFVYILYLYTYFIFCIYILYLYTYFIFCIYILYLYTYFIFCIYILYLYTYFIFCIYILYLYTYFIFCIYILYLYTYFIFCIYILYLYTYFIFCVCFQYYRMILMMQQHPSQPISPPCMYPAGSGGMFLSQQGPVMVSDVITVSDNDVFPGECSL